jgi:hypothetical protein
LCAYAQTFVHTFSNPFRAGHLERWQEAAPLGLSAAGCLHCGTD